jgi:hypothetical protein
MLQEKYGRRSTKDPRWQDLKARVDRRDRRRCRALACLTITEAKAVLNSTEFNKKLDRAHLFAASQYPELIYTDDNVVLLSHTFHERFDQYRDLITGDVDDSLNRHFWWQFRIMSRAAIKYDEAFDYELACRRLVGLSPKD